MPRWGSCDTWTGCVGVWMPGELDRWRERQLDVFQRAQVIDALEKQRLFGEYQHAELMGRMDQQNVSLSAIGAILADTNAHVGWMEADMSRLLAVTERDLPVIVEHLALACETLANIARMLASPRETEAQELFKSGTHALATAAKMARQGATGLADDWFDEAIEDLQRATGVFRQVPGSWYNLSLAYASRGPSRDAADAFAACARYAVADGLPGLAAEAVMLAAAELRSIGDYEAGRSLLRKYLPPLDRCAELYVSLAVHHGEADLLTPAFKIAPLLAAAVQAKIDELKEEATSQGASAEAKQGAAELAARLTEAAQAAAAEACRSSDGPVVRLHDLESASQAVLEAAAGAGLDFSADGFTPVALPAEPGVAALLLAEVRVHEVVEQARAIAAKARAGLYKLAATTQARQHAVQGAKTTGAERIKEAEAKVSLSHRQVAIKEREGTEAQARQANKARNARAAADRAKRNARAAADRAREELATAKRALAELETELVRAEEHLEQREAEVSKLRGVMAAWEAVYDQNRSVRLDGVGGYLLLRPEIEADLKARARHHGDFPRVDLVQGSPPHVLITWAQSPQDPHVCSLSMSDVEARAKSWGTPGMVGRDRRLPVDVPLEEWALIWISSHYGKIYDGLRWAERLADMVREPAERARAEVQRASAEVERASAEVERALAAADREEARPAIAAARDQPSRSSGVDAARASLKEAEEQYEQVVQLVQEEIRNAEAEHDAARHAADRAAASISRVLATLETAITTATAPRNRIVPRTGTEGTRAARLSQGFVASGS